MLTSKSIHFVERCFKDTFLYMKVASLSVKGYIKENLFQNLAYQLMKIIPLFNH